MKKNKKALSRMMTEFSQELGMTPPKRSRVGKGMLLAAGGIVGYTMIKGMLNKMK